MNIEDIQADIREAADSDLPAFQKSERLTAIRDDLEVALTEVKDAILEAEAEADSQSATIGVAVMALRERATVSDNLLAEGLTTVDEVVASGVLDHGELDRLDEEGLLEGVAQELIASGKIDATTGEWIEADEPVEEHVA